MASIQPGSFTNTFTGRFQETSDLPLGAWDVLANGRFYTLTIHSVTAAGVEAQFSSGAIHNAQWNPEIGLLTFSRVLPNLNQKYQGYLLQYSKHDPLWRLAGTFEHAEPRAVSGWYATRLR